jgi:hypothetical protein
MDEEAIVHAGMHTEKKYMVYKRGCGPHSTTWEAAGWRPITEPFERVVVTICTTCLTFKISAFVHTHFVWVFQFYSQEMVIISLCCTCLLVCIRNRNPNAR